MPRKLKEPPRAVFTPRVVKICELEKSKSCDINQEWIKELNLVEERIKNCVSLDILRLKKICDTTGDLECLCKVLKLKIPRGEVGEEPSFSLHDFPGVGIGFGDEKNKTTITDLSSKTSNASDVLENDEYRKTLFETALVRATAKREHISEHKVQWSEEVSFATEDVESIHSESSVNVSLETPEPLSEDLFVNPAGSQIAELLEPLMDAGSPYQKFFSRTVKEVHEHVDRLRKKKFHSFSEKCIEDFVKYLDENDIRSPNVTSETLNNIFEAEVERPVEHAFRMDPRELPSVPKEIADLYHEPHSSIRARLHQQIMSDIIYEKEKGSKVAIGKRLPKKIGPRHRNTKERWFIPPGKSWDLITGKDFWEDLLHTEILEGFGLWLLNNPQYEKPQYLVKIGFFDYLKDKRKTETEPINMPVKTEEEFVKILDKLKHPLSFDADQDKFQQLPRYEELEKANYPRRLNQEGQEECDDNVE